MTKPRFPKLALLLPALLLLTGAVFSPALTTAQPPEPLRQLLDDSAAEFDVPAELLIALGWTRSHMQNQVSEAEEYGPMQLSAQPPNQVSQAAALLGLPDEAIKNEPRHNIRGAAALLHQAAQRLFPNQTELTAADWFDVTAAISFPDNPGQGRDHARQVFALLAEGLSVQVAGETLAITPWPEAAPLVSGPEVRIASDDFAPAHWLPAHASNFSAASRGPDNIDMIVIHTTEGSYNAVLNWFTLASTNASAHYVIRSSDGDITQMVREADIAWHAGDWTTNTRSIGIEHEAFINDPTWYTDTMYQASAALVRHLAAKYGIPLDRQHIIGHVEVPGCPYTGGGASCHTDPGPSWDWDKFMRLVQVDVPTPTPSPGATPTATVSPQPDGTGNLIGLVTNAATGARLPGATVSAAGQTVTSNSNGVYYFPGLPAGEVAVTVTLPGFSPVTQAGRVEANTTRWNSVRLTPLANSAPTASPTATASPSPTNTPTATASPSPTASATATASPTPAVTPSPAPESGALVGLITDARTGQRLAGVTVFALGQTFVTDARGYYWLGNLPAGPQTVSAQKPGYAAGQRSREVIAGGVQWNSIALQPLAGQ